MGRRTERRGAARRKERRMENRGGGEGGRRRMETRGQKNGMEKRGQKNGKHAGRNTGRRMEDTRAKEWKKRGQKNGKIDLPASSEMLPRERSSCLEKDDLPEIYLPAPKFLHDFPREMGAISRGKICAFFGVRPAHLGGGGVENGHATACKPWFDKQNEKAHHPGRLALQPHRQEIDLPFRRLSLGQTALHHDMPWSLRTQMPPSAT